MSTSPPPRGRAYPWSYRVRFGDCDPAGILYFPRMFDLFHRVMEDWVTEIGSDYTACIQTMRVGFPTVHTEADFRHPCALGDDLVIEQRLGRLGETSMELHFRVAGNDGIERALGLSIVVVMDLDPGSPGFRRARPLPAELRTLIEAWRALGD